MVDIYCTNCVHADVWYKIFGGPILTCMIGRQATVSIKGVTPPLACSEVKLISKLGDD